MTLRDEYQTDAMPLSSIKVAAIGGGTGMSTMLRGLKSLTHNITAIVTVADDGGGSGMLRTDMGILPPGISETVFWGLRKQTP